MSGREQEVDVLADEVGGLDAALGAKAPHRNRALYATVRIEPTTTPMRATQTEQAARARVLSRAVNTASFATKPSGGGGRPSRRARRRDDGSTGA